MSQFPKAKPGTGERRARAPKRWRAHVFHADVVSDCDGEPLCAVEDCGMRRDHRTHDVRVPDEAGEIDARRLGEAE